MNDSAGSRRDAGQGAAGLGVRLRGLREDAGLTLSQAAGAAGLSLSYLSDVERGRRVPTLDALDRLARALGTLACDVLAGVHPYGAQEPGGPVVPPPDGRSAGRRRRP